MRKTIKYIWNHPSNWNDIWEYIILFLFRLFLVPFCCWQLDLRCDTLKKENYIEKKNKTLWKSHTTIQHGHDSFYKCAAIPKMDVLFYQFNANMQAHATNTMKVTDNDSCSIVSLHGVSFRCSLSLTHSLDQTVRVSVSECDTIERVRLNIGIKRIYRYYVTNIAWIHKFHSFDNSPRHRKPYTHTTAEWDGNRTNAI